MRLINYGVGEIVDRLTILSLKIAHTSEDQRSYFPTERAALLTQLQGRTLNGAWFEHVITLGTVNGLLWQREDDLRQYRRDTEDQPERDDPKAIASLAFEIQALNDQRARLIETINKLTGDHRGSEKIDVR